MNAYADSLTIGECVGLLKRHYRFCVGCGRVRIPPNLPPGVIRCSDCEPGVEAKCCRHCGEMLPRGLIDFMKTKGKDCLKCFYCNRGYTQPHPVFGVKCPRHWKNPDLPPTIMPVGVA